MAKDFSKNFYNSSAWRKLAKRIRQESFHICQQCGAANANTVHHKIELTPTNINNPAITLNENNLILLCRECHDKIHDRFLKEKDGRQYSYDSQGHVISIATAEEK